VSRKMGAAYCTGCEAMARTRKRRSDVAVPIVNQLDSRGRKRLQGNSMTQAEVYPFPELSGCAKLARFRRVLQFTVGLRIVICLPAARAGRATGG
jgi:hypothetical protein